jgi:hypothetical protein
MPIASPSAPTSRTTSGIFLESPSPPAPPITLAEGDLVMSGTGLTAPSSPFLSVSSVTAPPASPAFRPVIFSPSPAAPCAAPPVVFSSVQWDQFMSLQREQLAELRGMANPLRILVCSHWAPFLFCFNELFLRLAVREKGGRWGSGPWSRMTPGYLISGRLLLTLWKMPQTTTPNYFVMSWPEGGISR